MTASSSAWGQVVLCSLAVMVNGLVAALPVAKAAPSVGIEPVLMVGARWESNFYQTEENEKAMYSYLVGPGISLEVEGARLDAHLDYQLEAHYYQDADDGSSNLTDRDQDAGDLDYMGHYFSLGGGYDITSRLGVSLLGSYYDTRYPFYYDRLSTQSFHQEYEIYRLTPAISYDVTRKFTAGLRYDYVETNFESEDEYYPFELNNADYEMDLWTLDFSYTLWPSFTVDLDLQQGEINYEERFDDYDSRRVWLNAQKRFRRISLDGGVGYTNNDYHASEREDEGLVTWRLRLTDYPSLSTGRTQRMSSVYARPLEHAYLAVERQFNTIGDRFVSTRLVGSIGSRWGEKFESRIKGWYQNSDYQDLNGFTPEGNLATRELNTWDLSASLGFNIVKGLLISVTAGNREQDSNLITESYTNTYGFITLSYNFDQFRRSGFTNEILYY